MLKQAYLFFAYNKLHVINAASNQLNFSNSCLTRFAGVTACGDYVTDVKDDGARFSVMLAALLTARLSLCFQGIAAAKVIATLERCLLPICSYFTICCFLNIVIEC